MDITLNQKIIKEMCGTVSFKKGDSFYRANKVTFEDYSPDRCSATITGLQDILVTIEKDSNGGFRTNCTCPTLVSVKNDCQHIAAVLLAIYDHQRHNTIPIVHTNASANQALTEGLMSIFNNQRTRSSGHQLHFENRQVLDLVFTCKPVSVDGKQYLLGIEMTIGPIKIKNIRDFLRQVKTGNLCTLSPSFTYDPALHCFPKETDAVIQRLIPVIHDEEMYVDSLPDSFDYTIDNHLLLIPPSSGERLIPLLTRAPLVRMEYDGNTFEGFHFLEEELPLQFDFAETASGDYKVKIKGINRMVVLNSYKVVLYDGKLIQLRDEENKRLSELKQMLDDSGTNQIPIPRDQMNFFMEKVVPGLRKLGDVRLSEGMTQRLEKTPLSAKLYLDRVKNRLLAGLEFHYGNIVINPLESREIQNKYIVIRDVGKENEILKLMDDSSFTKTDEGYFLHNEELEYEFLQHVTPMLQKLVQIYATTAVRNRVVRDKAFPKIRIKYKKERTDWLEFKFEMDGIPEKEIREILKELEEKRKYYRLRNGSLLSLETREFEEIRRFLHAAPVQDEDLESGFDVPIVRGLRLLDSVDDSSTFTIEESFRHFLEKLKSPDERAFAVPKSLDSILRDYQKHGYRWMKTMASYGFGGILADDMGLGKTLQSIAFILSELPNIRERKRPVLIVCPASLTYNWLSECKKFTPEIQAIVVDGNKDKRSKIRKDVMDKDVVITSYPMLRSDIQWYEKQSFHTAFFDEAQAFKNPFTQTARAVKKIQADYRFALTGTPVENSLEELWSIFHVVFPELFLGLKEYSDLPREKIARRARPFLLRRLKENVLAELPGKRELTESMELLPEQKKLYAAYLSKLKHDTLKHLDRDTLRKNRIRILAGLTRLRQICCHPALFVDGYKGSSAKFEQLMRIIEESRLSGRRVLIFSQFTKMLKIIGKDLAIQGLPFFYLDGQTPSEERVEICNRFNAGERDLFLISLKAGGTGLNLTGADTVILYDIWWNPAVEQQAADRAHRIGQANVVEVIKLVARGTIEEKMNQLQVKKRDLMEEVIGAKENSRSTLTEEDIKEILML
ncbi:DEAD/DEAH box helicase [Radiobacillus kanasensis]|uniref:DEAD/DEAH box helicase n=1 Tax=Radiobacillus kanasensis TaxID=2844358 RepID=UPI001E4201AD|nr:DEAD/DEAH box helicase [Radiobacillus kanasensis]UFT99299.1 DEAD/DEAH box helicase [Radiobacillus kanasensis]